MCACMVPFDLLRCRLEEEGHVDVWVGGAHACARLCVQGRFVYNHRSCETDVFLGRVTMSAGMRSCVVCVRVCMCVRVCLCIVLHTA